MDCLDLLALAEPCGFGRKLLWEQRVVSSNPTAPTIEFNGSASFGADPFCFSTLSAALSEM